MVTGLYVQLWTDDRKVIYTHAYMYTTSPRVVRKNHDVAFSELFSSECGLINYWNKNEIKSF